MRWLVGAKRLYRHAAVPDGYGAYMAAGYLRGSGRKTFAEHRQAADRLCGAGLVLKDVGGDPLSWTVKQLNFEWADSLRFGQCRELSTAGRRVASHDHDAGRRWATRMRMTWGFVPHASVRK